MDIDFPLPAERVVCLLNQIIEWLGKPQQNTYVERYNHTVHHDYLFESIAEVQVYATNWMWTYNHQHPNMALGRITPKQNLAAAI